MRVGPIMSQENSKALTFELKMTSLTRHSQERPLRKSMMHFGIMVLN